MASEALSRTTFSAWRTPPKQCAARFLALGMLSRYTGHRRRRATTRPTSRRGLCQCMAGAACRMPRFGSTAPVTATPQAASRPRSMPLLVSNLSSAAAQPLTTASGSAMSSKCSRRRAKVLLARSATATSWRNALMAMPHTKPPDGLTRRPTNLRPARRRCAKSPVSSINSASTKDWVMRDTEAAVRPTFRATTARAIGPPNKISASTSRRLRCPQADRFRPAVSFTARLRTAGPSRCPPPVGGLK